MARTNNLSNFLTDVASAIKSKKGSNTDIIASDFDTEIMSIQTGGNYQTKNLTLSTNGNYTLNPDVGYDAMSSVQITAIVTGGGTILDVGNNNVSVNGTTLIFGI